MALESHRSAICVFPKGLIYFNTKLKILERRHQRIREVKAKHELLKDELEETKHRLMLDPNKWRGECE